MGTSYRFIVTGASVKIYQLVGTGWEFEAIRRNQKLSLDKATGAITIITRYADSMRTQTFVPTPDKADPAWAYLKSADVVAGLGGTAPGAKALALLNLSGVSKSGTIYMDSIVGSTGADRLYGLEGDDTLNGLSGDDRIEGGTGDDTISGGPGFDVIHGGTGNDVIHGDTDADVIYGDEGEDTLLGDEGNDVVWGGTGNDVIMGGGGNDQLHGGTGEDTIDGGPGNDRIDGGTGNDTLIGNDGDDVIVGDTGMDVIDGGAGNDRISGGTGEDTLVGREGDDIIDGGSGNDVIRAGPGRDVMTGGDFTDRFVFADGDMPGLTRGTIDEITDFSTLDRDRIDLTGVDADSTRSGYQTLKFIGTAAFTHHAGELRYEGTPGDFLLMGDTNGDGRADFAIWVKGALTSLTLADFVL